jgi:putative oxidoreductase
MDSFSQARLLLATLFLIFGARKVRDYSGTLDQMVGLGLPMPIVATLGSIVMELPVASAVAIGAFTRPAAALMALYSLGTALIGHRYWSVEGPEYVDSLEGFLQRSWFHGRLRVVVHYRSRKIFN